MILTVDIGNTSIHFGIFDDNNLINNVRYSTNKENIYDTMQGLKKIKKKYSIESIAISSVVPSIDKEFSNAIFNEYKIRPLFIDKKLKTGVKNLSEKYSGLGSDRICDLASATSTYSGNLIIVNMGTATKYEIIDTKSNYLGGAIGPGLVDSYRSIINSADKLKHQDLVKIKSYYKGNNTIEQLSSGFILGFASMIDGMIWGIVEESKLKNIKVILTGGQAVFIKNLLKNKVIYDEFLTLRGINYISSLNISK